MGANTYRGQGKGAFQDCNVASDFDICIEHLSASARSSLRALILNKDGAIAYLYEHRRLRAVQVILAPAIRDEAIELSPSAAQRSLIPPLLSNLSKTCLDKVHKVLEHIPSIVVQLRL